MFIADSATQNKNADPFNGSGTFDDCDSSEWKSNKWKTQFMGISSSVIANHVNRECLRFHSFKHDNCKFIQQIESIESIRCGSIMRLNIEWNNHSIYYSILDKWWAAVNWTCKRFKCILPYAENIEKKFDSIRFESLDANVATRTKSNWISIAAMLRWTFKYLSNAILLRR